MEGTEGEGYEGGRDHKLGDVSGCGEDERLPRPALPPPGRGASLQFAISGVFNLGVERSAGPTFKKTVAPSRRSVRGNIEADETLRGRGKSASPIRWIVLFLIYQRPNGK